MTRGRVRVLLVAGLVPLAVVLLAFVAGRSLTDPVIWELSPRLVAPIVATFLVAAGVGYRWSPRSITWGIIASLPAVVVGGALGVFAAVAPVHLYLTVMFVGGIIVVGGFGGWLGGYLHGQVARGALRSSEA